MTFSQRTDEYLARGLSLAEAIAHAAHDETHPQPTDTYTTAADGRITTTTEGH